MINDAEVAPTGKGAGFWGGMMFATFGTAAGLFMSGVVDVVPGMFLMIAPGVLFAPLMKEAGRRAGTDLSGTCTKGEAQWRYAIRTGLFSSLYFLALAAMMIAEKEFELTDTIKVILALMPGLAVVGIFWAVGRLILEEPDEFMRMLIIRQALIASALALSAASVWGFLEDADIVVHVDAYWWAVLWFFGLGVGAIVNRIQYGTWGAA